MQHLGARTVERSNSEKSGLLRALSHCLIFRSILMPLSNLGYSPSWNTCATFSRSDRSWHGNRKAEGRGAFRKSLAHVIGRVFVANPSGPILRFAIRAWFDSIPMRAVGCKPCTAHRFFLGLSGEASFRPRAIPAAIARAMALLFFPAGPINRPNSLKI